MRVALAKGSLRVPPTYFAVQHALALHDRADFRFFTMAAHVTDPLVVDGIDIQDASLGSVVPNDRLSWPQRERALPLLMGRMARQIVAFRPDVVHQHFANWSRPAVVGSRRAQVPLLLTVHGADVHVPLTPVTDRNLLGRPMLRWHQRMVRDAFAQAERVLAVSEYLAGVAVRAGVDHRKLAVHYQGVDTDAYVATTRDFAQLPRVVFVGALTEGKGIRDLLEASAEIQPARPHELVVVGDGPLRTEVDRRAAELGNVRVLGALDRSGVRDALAGAAAFALPTQSVRGRREAAGLVILEAQAMGVPVVVYDSGGTSEMLDRESTGFAVPERDVTAMGQAIGDILDLGPAEWRAMSGRARTFVERRRSLRASAAELMVHYQELVR
jgi:glycosyltransferase involved in cell wall biosynthesis